MNNTVHCEKNIGLKKHICCYLCYLHYWVWSYREAFAMRLCICSLFVYWLLAFSVHRLSNRGCYFFLVFCPFVLSSVAVRQTLPATMCPLWVQKHILHLWLLHSCCQSVSSQRNGMLVLTNKHYDASVWKQMAVLEASCGVRFAASW